MSKLMLIDAVHPEETRVALTNNGRVNDFDFETAGKRQLRGNIYLAKITRVEPSLQAAFVEYGGNRHGFLAFSEIHPDYYQLPKEDREALLREAAEEAALDDDEFDLEIDEETIVDSDDQDDDDDEDEVEASTEDEDSDDEAEDLDDAGSDEIIASSKDDDADDEDTQEDDNQAANGALDASEDSDDGEENENNEVDEASANSDDADDEAEETKAKKKSAKPARRKTERKRRSRRPSMQKRYKIQEVIRRRQVLLVQVVKEERGNKGAALTTYLSLAGRYSVLMPNTPRGGGISRKIANGSDRKRLKEVVKELDVPQGMGLIVRTAGAKRTKAEIKRDYDYLNRLWNQICDVTLTSMAPTLIHEEGGLVHRAMRDMFDKEIEEVLIQGDDAYREAKDLAKMIMPSQAKKVKPWKEAAPVFVAEGVEEQLDQIYSPEVKLKSGGYLVINQTEALVAIDVNSGKSTRERNIEQTALRTNLEAAEEACRQMRLRDLAGLVVIDFIDMDENKNNRAVEKKLKECLRLDRARVQYGRISQFGLMEISRQRRRAGVLQATSDPCEYCNGTGRRRSVSSAALQLLRAMEARVAMGGLKSVKVTAPTEVALYLLNNKREAVSGLEQVSGLAISIASSESLIPGDFELDAERDPNAKSKPKRRRRPRREETKSDSEEVSEIEDDSDEDAEESQARDESEDSEGDGKRKRRRRGRRGGRRRRKITPTATSTGRRRMLADWITRPDNPLTTRVIVNRVWQYHFGRGIVASASEFGALGEEPTHPELLDHLTTKFVSSGWRLKALHREIMLSATYRQTARREPDTKTANVDPTNNFLWRFHPRRLDAEQVRDAMLAVSGELDLRAGGPASDGNGVRRSIYVRRKRNRPDVLLTALDKPAGFASTSQRQSTTTPTQALQLINGDWVLARARRLASRVKTVEEAWLAVLGREPRDHERATAEAFLTKRIKATEAQRDDSESTKNEALRGQFRINSEYERLVTRASEREGDDFTVEAVVKLNTIDMNAETRTLVTRWNGDKKSLGWSIDVTGVKSRYQPRNILMQLVGEDKNGNIGYQIVVSDLRFPLNRRQHLVVHVAGSRREVIFTLRDLDAPQAAAQSATVRIDDLSRLSQGDYPIVLGGQSVRRTTRQWDGDRHGRSPSLKRNARSGADRAFEVVLDSWFYSSSGFIALLKSSTDISSTFAFCRIDSIVLCSRTCM